MWPKACCSRTKWYCASRCLESLVQFLVLTARTAGLLSEKILIGDGGVWLRNDMTCFEKRASRVAKFMATKAVEAVPEVTKGVRRDFHMIGHPSR